MYIIRLTEEKKGNRLELASDDGENPETILFSTYLDKSSKVRMEMHMKGMSHIIGAPIK